MTAKIELHVWYKTLDRQMVMLVRQLPWYHPRRWIGLKYQDQEGIYRTAQGNICDLYVSSGDLNFYTRAFTKP